jgi:hypothetical protein
MVLEIRNQSTLASDRFSKGIVTRHRRSIPVGGTCTVGRATS